MGIDTGLNLIYNQNYPVVNINQSSQQFRDNFSIIKTALERVHAATNSNQSTFDLNVNQSTDGIITIDVNYTGNSLILPSGDPSISLASGMIRYNSSLTAMQLYDGIGWKKIINQDSSGNVTLSNLAVTNRITTTNLTINSDPAIGTDAVRLSYLNTALSNMSISGGLVSSAQLQAEANARAESDAALQVEIDSINNTINNAGTTSASISAQMSNLSNAIAAETSSRISADNSQLGMINSIGDQVNTTNGGLTNLTYIVDQEISSRTDADALFAQDLRDLSNSVNNSTGLASEISARIAGDSALSNSIADLTIRVNSVGTYLPTSGGTMTGDLAVSNASVKLDSGQYLLFNSSPNPVNGHDGGFITYDPNNFSYARMATEVATAVAADIAANGIANANTHWELSCLRIGTTNDPDNGLNNDSIALEPSADLWLNPGWSGGGIAEDGTGTPDLDRIADIQNASVYVGNAATWTIKMVRSTGDIITNGTITAAGDISGLSDASLKDNVHTIENALDKIDNLRGVLYTRNDLQGNPEQIGLIAQEVKETIPQVVHETENGLLSVSYGNLVALLIEGIKDLRKEIEDIKKKIN